MRAIVTLTLGALLVCASSAAAQSWRPPADSERCPSKWGAGDQRGRAHEFAIVVEPLKIQGGTESSVAPIAIR